MTDLQVDKTENGEIVVVDRDAGHRFAFKLVTERGSQTLSGMAPAWSGGTEPPGAHGLSQLAREVADGEARDQGWIEAPDLDVG